MSVKASQITGNSTVYSTVILSLQQRSITCGGIYQWRASNVESVPMLCHQWFSATYIRGLTVCRTQCVWNSSFWYPFTSALDSFTVYSHSSKWQANCLLLKLFSCFLVGEGALRVKISRGAPLEVQNGTQQDLNKMIDLVNFGGQKDRLPAANGGLLRWDPTRSE